MPITKHNHYKAPRLFRLLIISATIGLFCGIVLIGIPGALVLELIGWAYLYLGMSPLEMTGDSVWPTAIIISILWPFGIPLISYLYYKLRPQHTLTNRWLVSLFGSILLTITITFIIYM